MLILYLKFFANEAYGKWQDLGIDETIFNLGSTPKFTLNTGSILLTGASFTGLTGFDVVTHRGAFGTSDWTAGWANFTPQTNIY